MRYICYYMGTPTKLKSRSKEDHRHLTDEQIQWLNGCTSLYHEWTFDRKNGQVNVEGDFSCVGQGLTDFKGVRFGFVSGSFHCTSNNLTTLDGAPLGVGGDFSCSENLLTTLEGAPQDVGWDFYCHSNQLTTLKGSPQNVGGNFNCGCNHLTSLEGAPQRVGVNFYCHENQLTSLEGAPVIGSDIITNIVCGNNPVSLETLVAISNKIQKGSSYIQALESFWKEINVYDQALLYRPEFEWVGPEEGRKLEALRSYNDIKNMI